MFHMNTEVFREAKALGLAVHCFENVRAGDLYLAKRNGPVRLLTSKFVDLDNCWIIPEESGEYVFDIVECYKVVPDA